MMNASSVASRRFGLPAALVLCACGPAALLLGAAAYESERLFQ